MTLRAIKLLTTNDCATEAAAVAFKAWASERKHADLWELKNLVIYTGFRAAVHPVQLCSNCVMDKESKRKHEAQK